MEILFAFCVLLIGVVIYLIFKLNKLRKRFVVLSEIAVEEQSGVTEERRRYVNALRLTDSLAKYVVESAGKIHITVVKE